MSPCGDLAGEEAEKQGEIVQDAVNRGLRYTLQDPAELNVTWVPLPVAKKSRKDFQGLPTGVKVWIQVRASNSRGEGLWSNPACKRVP